MIERIFFYPEIVVEQGKTHTWFYSPPNHRWARVENYFSPILHQIIRDRGEVIFENIKHAFEKESHDSLTPSELEHVVEQLLLTGVFFQSRDQYNESVQSYLCQGSRLDQVYIHMVYLHMTVRCNYRCWYCYNNRLEKSRSDELGTQQWLDIVDRLHAVKARTFVFTGGEPLLRTDLEEVIQKAKRPDTSVTLLTNGSLFTAERLHRIVPLVDEIMLSLDSFDRTIQARNRSELGFENILQILKYFPNGRHNSTRLTVRSVITKENSDSVMKFRDTLKKKYKISNHMLVKFIPSRLDELPLVPEEDGEGVTEEEIVESTPLPSDYRIFPDFRRRCEACTNAIAVTPRGDIYPCQSFLDLPEYKVANLLEDDWFAAYKSSPIRRMFHEISVDNMPVCRECQYRYLCGGGCPALSKKLYGDINHRVDYQCEIKKKQAKLFLKTSQMVDVKND